MPNVFVMGFIGCGNLGDEAILAGTLQSLRECGVARPVVFSWSPQQTAQAHSTQSLPVLAGMRGLRDFATHLHRGDLFIMGGGSLLQDGHRRIVPFWLSRALVAKLRGCTVVYHAQGVGPLHTSLARALMRIIVPWTADAFTVRDTLSRELLLAIPNVHLVADPALLLAALEVEKCPGRVVVALRNTKHDAELARLVDCLKLFSAAAEVQYVFLPMHIPDDVEVCTQVAALTGGTVYEGPFEVQYVRKLLASAELVVAMRLHAAILATGVATPSVGLSYDPKVLSFYAELGLPEYVLPWHGEFDANLCSVLLTKAYRSRLELAEQTKKQASLLRDRAQNSIPIAVAKWRSRGDENSQG
ncbi:MAG: polysaccharide pyruvyl transferase [Bacillota bacterium]|nr:MAG: polysaccharide pyruvyl transferase [Bacillota bacterium]